MVIEENVFFRETTLRICSSLEIEKSLRQCFLYIREHIPAGYMSLVYYHYDTGIVETIAEASIDAFPPLPLKIQLSQKARKRIAEEWMDLRVRLVERLSDNEITLVLAQIFDNPDLSAIIIDLMVEGQELGVLVVISEGKRIFTQEDIRLLTLLNEPFAIALTNSLRYQELLDLKNLLSDDNLFLKEELWRLTGDSVIGADHGLKGVMELVKQVAPLDSPVLLLGETGTGKEVIAGAIHNLSPRRDGPFIKVNCGAIPESLMDSELFGHEKGAFTGAISKKRGRFERAHGGTIFLDEIGELHPEAQVRLLRVLQEKEIERVGGIEIIKVDIRVIAATHSDLEALRAKGIFREDLYFRLKVFPIVVPPLRKRSEDIAVLVHHFIQKKYREIQLTSLPTLVPGAIERLMAYNWPGNVRELENAVERELILSRGEPLAFNDMNCPKTESAGNTNGHLMNESLNLDQAMKAHIEKALNLAGGKVEGKGGGAELLSINPRTLRHRMKKLGVRFGRNAAKANTSKI